MVKESDLYAPVKALLEARGYEVKAEINGCDVVACKDGASTVVVELKLAFSIELLLQGVDRLNLAKDIYLAIPAADTPTKRKNWRSRQRGYLKLCRMLGLGLMTVDLMRKEDSQVEVLVDPAPYTPRRNKRKQTRLLAEFSLRAGDPNAGGVTRTKIITSYRQDAVRCAMVLGKQTEMKVADIRSATGVLRAASILQNNHYGWFERTTRGVYRLTPLGHEGLKQYAGILPPLVDGPR